MIELTIKLNPTMAVKIAENDEQKVIQQAAFWQSLPGACPLCGAAVHLQYRHPAGFEYYGLECEGETVHESNFGQRKDGSGMYYKNGWKPRPAGVGAYDDETPDPQPPARSYAKNGEPALRDVRHANECAGCHIDLTDGEIAYSQSRFGKPLCRTCQNAQARPAAPAGTRGGGR